ncbi:MAG: hypothetical protein ACHQJX_12635, partial [Candidatus Acidiferrales bacterium]
MNETAGDLSRSRRLGNHVPIDCFHLGQWLLPGEATHDAWASIAELVGKAASIEQQFQGVRYRMRIVRNDQASSSVDDRR